MRLQIGPLAEADIESVFRFLAQENIETAFRFLNALEETYTQLLQSPQIGALVELSEPRLSSLRKWRVKGFAKVLVFYIPQEETVLIIRVLHGARDIEALLEEPLSNNDLDE